MRKVGAGETAFHLVFPVHLLPQPRLVGIGDAQIAVLDGIDQQFRQAQAGGIRIAAQARQRRGQLTRFVERVEGKFAVTHHRHHALQFGAGLAQTLTFGHVVQHVAHQRHQRLRLVGLGQIIVGAGLQPFAHIGLTGSGGLHDHRHAGPGRIGLHLAQQAHAIKARHHAVEHDQVVTLRRHPLQRLEAIGGCINFVALLGQRFFDDKQVNFFIIYSQQATHAPISSGLGLPQGITNSNMAPWPAALSAVRLRALMVPLCR